MVVAIKSVARFISAHGDCGLKTKPRETSQMKRETQIVKVPSGQAGSGWCGDK